MPRKQNLFIIFIPGRNVKKPCFLPCDEAHLGSHAFLYTLVGFFDSSELSDLFHSSIGLFLKVFFELMKFIFFVVQYSLNIIACIVRVL